MDFQCEAVLLALPQLTGEELDGIGTVLPSGMETSRAKSGPTKKSDGSLVSTSTALPGGSSEDSC